jgi:hypothetical protein
MEGKTSQLTLPCRMELIEDDALVVITVSGVVNQHPPPHWRSAGRSGGVVEREKSSREGVLPLRQATTMSNRWLRPSDRRSCTGAVGQRCRAGLQEGQATGRKNPRKVSTARG